MQKLRKIELRSKANDQEGILRVFSPGDIGERLKPFVFLDYLHMEIEPGFGFGFHPHSGIATVTYQLDCDVNYIDTEGYEGTLKARGVEWMMAGGGAWHRGYLQGRGLISGFQLWLALPSGVEDGPSESVYLSPAEVPQESGLSVLAGSYSTLRSQLHTPFDFNYFNLALDPGKSWSFQPPPDHDVAWAYIYKGEALVNGQRVSDELVIFDRSPGALHFEALGACALILGTAKQHQFPLVLGSSSVHTNPESLAKGLDRIRKIGQSLAAQGKLE
jgi:redox-sensitive bicupin YhaK (pirin superfamily)